MPPACPQNPEGETEPVASAGPFVVSESRAASMRCLCTNTFCRGDKAAPCRPAYGRLPRELLRRCRRARRAPRRRLGFQHRQSFLADWRRLAAKYEVNRSQFFVEPSAEGTKLSRAMNTSRPLFRDEILVAASGELRARSAGVRCSDRGELGSRPTNQGALPPPMRGFKDAPDLPARRPDSAPGAGARARRRGRRRSGSPPRPVRQADCVARGRS